MEKSFDLDFYGICVWCIPRGCQNSYGIVQPSVFPTGNKEAKKVNKLLNIKLVWWNLYPIGMLAR
jgi:hypothetical protein